MNPVDALIKFRPFQSPVFWSTLGLLVLHWSRQIGKSYVLAAWAVYQCLTNPGRLVTVLSNSKDNGTEFIQKCTQICQLLSLAYEEEDLSPDEFIENMRVECRIKAEGKWGRIIVLAANPRTARGFSGDLILDEYAFHEDSYAIWDAAEPIISSNEKYKCRIASTGNGRFNMFYRMAGVADYGGRIGEFYRSIADCPVSRVTRTDAWQQGIPIFDPLSRTKITPEEARAKSLDKASYDQNYECSFNDENMALLTHDLIQRAEYLKGADSKQECFIDSEEWKPSTIEFLRSCKGPLGMGVDIGRSRDITAVAIGEKLGDTVFTRALLRMSNKRLPYQREQLRPILELGQFGRGEMDRTGLGEGLVEFSQELIGGYRVNGVHFASREHRVIGGVATEDTALVTELMALDGLKKFEDGRIRIPQEQQLRDALRKPERVQTANGVRIAVERDEAGHADEFWAIMLMIRALSSGMEGVIQSTSGIRLGGQGSRAKFIPRRMSGKKVGS